MRRSLPAMMVFFDIDETLLNQRRAEESALARFLDLFGEQLPQFPSIGEFCETWRRLRERHSPGFLEGRMGLREYRRSRIRELFASRQPDLSDEEADARFDSYLEEYRRNWCLFDDVLPCLSFLEDLSIGIISNGNTQQQNAKLNRTDIASRFATVVISEEIAAPKPKPEIFLAACQRAGLPPSQCIHVGDNLQADARASRTIGMRGIWLDRHGAAGPARGNGDVETVSNLIELREVLAHAVSQRG